MEVCKMRKFWNIVAVLFIAMMLSFPVTGHSAAKDMWAYVYSWDGKMNTDGKMVLTRITSGVTYVVLQTNSLATLETLTYYNNPNNTSLANPVTGTNFASDTISGDMIAFRCDPSETNDTAVDLIVVDQTGGYTAFVEDFDQYTHTVIIDERAGVRHHGCAFIATGGSSTETDTGIDFEDVSVIEYMMVEIGTPISGGTTPLLDVGLLSSGTNGDSDGFLNDCSLATAGFVQPYRAGIDNSSYSVTSSEQGGIINVGPVGTFLGHMYAGTGDTETLAAESCFVPQTLTICGTYENSLTYTFPTSHASTGFGLIHFWFTRIR